MNEQDVMNNKILQAIEKLANEKVPLSFYEDFGEQKNMVQRMIAHQKDYEAKLDKVLARLENSEHRQESKIESTDKKLTQSIEKVSERLNGIILTMFLGSFAFIGSIFLLFVKGGDK